MIFLLAEDKFLQAVSDVVGLRVDTTRSALVYANSQRNHYIDPCVSKILEEIKALLHSTEDFSNRHAPVDGIIWNHQELGTRVIEFDEYQHFTPQRKLTIEISEKYRPLSFHERYRHYLEANNIFEEATRTTIRSGFHKPVAGFRFDGGRMCQRAYFDTMKDYVHLSGNGQGFNPILRFSIPDFGVATEAQFLRLDSCFIRTRINDMLNDLID